MKEIVPLIQTMLWVGLIGVVLYRYHELIEGIVQSIHKRIDLGDGFRAGPLEFSPLAKPLEPEQQVRKLKEDVAQLVEAEDAERPQSSLPRPPDENIANQYARAEDLALREIQSEFGVPIGRQIRLAGKFPFDGAFAKDGRLYVIETKYSRTPIPRPIVQQTAGKLFTEMERRLWRNIRLIFVVVYSNSSIDLEKEKQRISDATSEHSDKIEIRCYHLKELATKYGVAPG
jgi:hypothetical protein